MHWSDGIVHIWIYYSNNNANIDAKSLVPDEFVDMILAFFLNHNLTMVGLEDEMKLLNAKKDDCEELPTGKKQIIDMFRKNREVFEVFYFVKCSKCKKSTIKLMLETNEKQSNSK